MTQAVQVGEVVGWVVGWGHAATKLQAAGIHQYLKKENILRLQSN
jgi:hypothetical protein